MPVTLEEVDQARWATDAQVAMGLSRIYHDASAERLPQAVEDCMSGHLTRGDSFCCALLNTRLPGAVGGHKTPNAWFEFNPLASGGCQ